MKIKSGRKSGFTLVEIMIVVAILGMLLAMAIPYYVRARANSQCRACINNMRQIDGAIQQWAVENRMKAGDTATYPDDLIPYIHLNAAGEIPPCPAGGDYSVAALGIIPPVNCTVANTVQPPHLLP